MKKSLLFFFSVLAVIVLTLIPAMANDGQWKEVPYPYIEGSRPCFVQDGTGYYVLTGTVTDGEFEKFIRANKIFERYKVGKIVIYLNSPGGSVFAGIGMAQLIEEQKTRGIIVEIRCYGLGASAAAIIMSTGSKGHRYIASGSFIMIHEILTFKFLSIESVSDTEKQAGILRMIQDEIISLLEKNTNLSKEELISKCREESWANAKTAIKWGFADQISK